MNQVKILVLCSLITLCIAQTIEHSIQEPVQTPTNTHHEIEVLKKEIKEIKYYLYEVKNILESQSKEIEGLKKTSENQGQTISKQSVEIQGLTRMIQNQDMDIKSLQNTIQGQGEEIKVQNEKISYLEGGLNQLTSNMTKYLSKMEMSSFLQTVDPTNITPLYYLRSYYARWLENQN